MSIRRNDPEYRKMIAALAGAIKDTPPAITESDQVPLFNPMKCGRVMATALGLEINQVVDDLVTACLPQLTPKVKKGRRRCVDCGTSEGVVKGPCPYAYDLRGDSTPVLLCASCSKARGQEIRST